MAGKLAKRLTRDIYLAHKFDQPMPDEGIRWVVAMDTGWALEYVDALSEGDMAEFLAYKRGQAASMKRTKGK